MPGPWRFQQAICLFRAWGRRQWIISELALKRIRTLPPHRIQLRRRNRGVIGGDCGRCVVDGVMDRLGMPRLLVSFPAGSGCSVQCVRQLTMTIRRKEPWTTEDGGHLGACGGSHWALLPIEPGFEGHGARSTHTRSTQPQHATQQRSGYRRLRNFPWLQKVVQKGWILL